MTLRAGQGTSGRPQIYTSPSTLERIEWATYLMAKQLTSHPVIQGRG